MSKKLIIWVILAICLLGAAICSGYWYGTRTKNSTAKSAYEEGYAQGSNGKVSFEIVEMQRDEIKRLRREYDKLYKSSQQATRPVYYAPSALNCTSNEIGMYTYTNCY